MVTVSAVPATALPGKEKPPLGGSTFVSRSRVTFGERRRMLTKWLRCGLAGDPGFCFYSDSALASLFVIFGWSMGKSSVGKMRERLGLQKACPKIPLVTGARKNAETGVIELNTVDASRAANRAKQVWPRTPVRLRCRVFLGDREFYPGSLG